ncbi:hypothetical protein [Nitrospirillum amazonense]|uniref:hypothetical protein n=1 Tax=Nitrospirillum amazonense TaxID=28077 RepID=UPI001648163F|nr:hypothetical protein [Nitrospirillum amazonense]
MRDYLNDYPNVLYVLRLNVSASAPIDRGKRDKFCFMADKSNVKFGSARSFIERTKNYKYVFNEREQEEKLFDIFPLLSICSIENARRIEKIILGKFECYRVYYSSLHNKRSCTLEWLHSPVTAEDVARVSREVAQEFGVGKELFGMNNLLGEFPNV